MRLYATVSSNRATKGQGGDYLTIEVKDQKKLTALVLHFEADGERIVPSIQGGTSEVIGDLLNELQQAQKEITKGEKKKDECKAHDWDNYGKCCNCGKWKHQVE